MSATSTPAPFRSWPRRLRRPLAASLAFPMAALALLMAGPGSAPLHAQATARPPQRLSFQGFLVDGNGAPLGQSAPKNYDIIFRIYNAETAGALLWTESQTVTVDQGHFSVLLGEGIGVGSELRPALSTLFKGATASERHVQITVAGIGPGGTPATILPRLQLLTSPYAFLAEQSTRIVSGESGDDILTSSMAGASHQISLHGSLSVANTLTASSFAGNGSALSGVLKPADLGGIQFENGHLRLHSPDLGVSGYGKALIFSNPGENSDPLWMSRYHAGNNLTELRINIGDDPTNVSSDKLVIGATLGGAFNQNDANWTPRFVFDARGLFGIGTTTPELPLHVNGSAGITGTNVLEFGRGLTKQGDAGKIGYGTFTPDALNIVGAGTTANTRRLQVYAEGGSTFTGSVTAQGLTVNTYSGLSAQITNPWLRVFHPSDKAKVVDLERVDNGVRIWASGGGFGNASGTTRWIVWDGDGNWDAGSDRKLKKNIEDAESVLDRALQVRLRRFHWKDEAGDGKKTMGVIAQELQPLFPDIVGETVDKETKEKLLTVGYADFGMVAIKALQELKARHDAETADLRAEVKALQAERQAQAAAEKARRQETAALEDRLSSLEKLLKETIAASKSSKEVKPPAPRVAAQ